MSEFYENLVAKNRKIRDPQKFYEEDLYFDGRPKFFKAIMRRLGFDESEAIDIRQFSRIIKPCSFKNLEK